MIINEVKLYNFGIYQGEHIFDFRVEPSGKNVVLINAKNGSGKTTLLTSIKVALYGPLLMGFRHINQQYTSYIIDKINLVALKEAEPKAGIILDFSMGGYGTADNYILERSWVFNNSDIIEKVHINKNGIELSVKEILEFENYIRKFFPPSLFEFFLFDGEQIHYQLEEGVLLNSIKDAFYSLFNLDLTTMLQQDLRSYLKQDAIFKKLDKEQQRYNTLLEEYNSLQIKSEEEMNEITALGQRIEELNNENKKLELEFKLNDGLAAEERDKARHKLAEYESKKNKEYDFLKYFIAEIFPFYITKDLIFAAREHVTSESRQKAIDIFNDTILNELKVHYSQIANQEGQKEFTAGVWYSLTDALNKMSNPLAFYHDLNESEKYQLLSLSEKLENLDPEIITKTQNNISRYNNRIYKLRKQIEVNETNEELNLLLQQINKNNQYLVEITELKTELEEQHDTTIELIDRVYTDLVSAEKIIEQSKTNDNIYSIVARVEKVLSRFQNEVARNKIKALQAHFLNCFINLNHKENFVEDAAFGFENNSFRIQLYDKDHSIINYNHLSAGEKQLFLLSLTWALLKTSQREVPLFFDTLLGRLDNDHRENIINKFLPNISRQVVVLSTDTEINDYYYKLLKPYIAMEYSISAENGNEKVISIQKSPGGQKSYAI